MIIENDFIFYGQKPLEKKTFQAKAPSNIALVKYWGKKGFQTPCNTSLSFTLDNCFTHTKIEVEQKKEKAEKTQVKFFFEGVENEKFGDKVALFFKNIEPYCPYLKQYNYKIYSSNSFPHSSGIASSASGMAALALSLIEMEKEMGQNDEKYLLTKASFLARIGSGSACRSTQRGYMIWGKHQSFEKSSDLYAVAYPEKIDKVFENYCDDVLIIDSGEKKISSSAGHNLMKDNPFSKVRFEQAQKNIDKMRGILKDGDLDGFAQVVESEALMLHAMFATGTPYFMLVKPLTVEAIEKIWQYRAQTKQPIAFTLDAGANLHVLYPRQNKGIIGEFVDGELARLCKEGRIIKN